MIGYLSGKLLALDEHNLLIEVNGVGYEVVAGRGARSAFGEPGSNLALWIHTHVREDQITLFGFKDVVQKKIFLILIGINGIGPKLAMSITSEMGAEELTDAITLGNAKLLCSIPGVGKKMADRMILELKDKFAHLVKESEYAALSGGGAQKAVWRDLIEALSGLGFTDQKIQNVLRLLRKDFEGKQPEINVLLKIALQKIQH